MELVNPPDGYVALFPESERTSSTATGFGTLNSNQCAVGPSKMLAYQKAVYRNIAADAGGRRSDAERAIRRIPLVVLRGSAGSGMAYYDAETVAAAQTALGRPLHIFMTPNDDPTVNSERRRALPAQSAAGSCRRPGGRHPLGVSHREVRSALAVRRELPDSGREARAAAS